MASGVQLKVNKRQNKISVKNARIGIIVGEFNKAITARLLEACLDELNKLGVQLSNISVVWVPGAFEIPVVAMKLAKKRTIHGVICLGAIIKGETAHYDHIAHESARGIMDVSLLTGKPIIYEILVCATMQMADDRSKKRGYNKGRVAAAGVLAMIDVLQGL